MTCPACGAHVATPFYELDGVPAVSMSLFSSRAEAIGCPRARLALHCCRCCGFIFNSEHKSELVRYQMGYEATQSYSATFDEFSRELAHELVRRYDLRGKTILEIGCGMGEFLQMLCSAGGNRGWGFDPAYVQGRLPREEAERLIFVRDLYAERYAHIQADLICCKMTLEHIPDVARFVAMVRSNAGPDSESLVFIQVPDVTRVLSEVAFWDIYHEHCSYFAPASIASLFRQCGFEPLRLWRSVSDQYLMLIARASHSRGATRLPSEEELSELAGLVEHFRTHQDPGRAAWRRRLHAIRESGSSAALWGGGSKAVGFLSALGGAAEAVRLVVDINPHRQNTFLSGTGHRIVPPEDLLADPPGWVIILNPAYTGEILGTMHNFGLEAGILTEEGIELSREMMGQ